MFEISWSVCPGETFYNGKKVQGPDKTVYGRNLRMFVLGRPFQPSLMFASKAVAHLSEEPFRCSTLGQAFGLTR
jgi:hypothetical protein